MTVIKLYGCYGCGKVRDDDDFQKSPKCSRCGSYHYAPIDATFWNMTRYFFTHPAKLTKLWVLENVLRCNS